MRHLISATILALTLTACGSSEPAAQPAETVTVTAEPEPAETVTVEPEAATGTELGPLCAEFRGTALGVKPADAIDNAVDLEDAVRAELDPGSGQYFAMMSVVGALYALGLADEGLSPVPAAQSHLADVGAGVLLLCDQE